MSLITQAVKPSRPSRRRPGPGRAGQGHGKNGEPFILMGNALITVSVEYIDGVMITVGQISV